MTVEAEVNTGDKLREKPKKTGDNFPVVCLRRI